MNHLVIYSHPNPKSFNHAIVDAYVKEVEQQKDEARVRDLYALGFDPVLRANELGAVQGGGVVEAIQEEQDQVAWADVIVFVYPLWWGGVPAITKGYLDRVFNEGFAYQFNEKGLDRLLTEKKVLTITTLGDSEGNYHEKGLIQAMNKLWDGIVFDFSGMQVVGHKYFGSVLLVGDDERKKMLEEVRLIARDI